ncbi:hypothetical protein ACFYV7_30170 [Nocardia suismassiliense]|uniref:Fe2OG dioxygenase domain-containing protein n=1 Tax=Nocardia suismassiliense TaxID=2077092 RepID=A0ABW6R0P6_9NOCA
MRSEAETLITHHGIRRDLTLSATGHTARRMRNVRRREINKYSTAVPAVYSCTELRGMLGQITGEAVLECPYQPEQYVITELSADGDTHGWHWDDYSFALVWIIECPPLADGGFVQCVPHTTWNKADPQLHRQFIDNPIYSHELLPGDLYLMRTDTGLHRVYPIRSGRRLIINMAYASQTDLNKQISHETMDTLWAERCSPDRATRPLSGPGD